MKIFIGSDHRGFQLKENVAAMLKTLGHEVVDVGTHTDSIDCDYPGISLKVCQAVLRNPGSRGILLCMTGLGHSIAANKIPGIYAALVYNKEAAKFARQHNDSNVLVLGAKFTGKSVISQIIKIWLSTEFEGGRHLRRKKQIQKIEKAASLINQGKFLEKL